MIKFKVEYEEHESLGKSLAIYASQDNFQTEDKVIYCGFLFKNEKDILENLQICLNSLMGVLHKNDITT